MVRCFVAVDIDLSGLEEKLNLIKSLLERSRARFTWSDPSKAHITLKFLGEVDEGRVQEIVECLNEISFESFQIEVGTVGFFPSPRRPRVVYLGVLRGSRELKELAKLVERSLLRLGFRREGREFSPHVTLARVKALFHLVPSIELEEVGREIRKELRVEELKLKRSTLTREGPIYSDIFVRRLG